MMSFVNHQHRRLLLAVTLNQVIPKKQQKVALGPPRAGKAKIPGDVLQELDGRQNTVEYVGVGHAVAVEQLQEAADQQCLARADLSGKDDETFVLAYAVVKCRQGFLVLCGRKQEARIGC